MGELDEGRLLEAAGSGDRVAQQSLTRAHLDWVTAAARERAGRGLSEADLFQEGTVGLIEAIRAFDASRRADFETFARESVAGRMEEALQAEERAVQDSQRLVQAASDYAAAEMALRRELQRGGTAVELAQKLEWSVERVREIAQMVDDARRRHDEELLQYLEADGIDLETLSEDRRSDDVG
ncbi:MAG TPA: sigma factor [Candidatus Dormibacteraeota bacterium]|nr:sigma factor [Candidatus Dormibacteraeota bacterium]